MDCGGLKCFQQLAVASRQDFPGHGCSGVGPGMGQGLLIPCRDVAVYGDGIEYLTYMISAIERVSGKGHRLFVDTREAVPR